MLHWLQMEHWLMMILPEKIVDAGIARVSISFDGADAKTHDEFRKITGSFERSIAGFKRLKDLGMSMQINCTIAKHNVEQIDDLYNMALKMGADAIHIFMLVPVGCGVQIADDQMLHPKKYEEVLNHFYDLSKEAKIQTKATCAPTLFSYHEGTRKGGRNYHLAQNTRHGRHDEGMPGWHRRMLRFPQGRGFPLRLSAR